MRPYPDVIDHETVRVRRPRSGESLLTVRYDVDRDRLTLKCPVTGEELFTARPVHRMSWLTIACLITTCTLGVFTAGYLVWQHGRWYGQHESSHP